MAANHQGREMTLNTHGDTIDDTLFDKRDYRAEQRFGLPTLFSTARTSSHGPYEKRRTMTKSPCSLTSQRRRPC
jgi:hypothetical protein